MTVDYLLISTYYFYSEYKPLIAWISFSMHIDASPLILPVLFDI